MRELDISEILNEMAEKGLVGEATVPKTVPTGKYTVRYNSYKGYEDENNGTPFVSINVAFEQDGNKKGTGFIKATWKKERNPNTGKLTRRAQLFGQLVKALDQTEDTPVPKVMDAFQSSLLGAFVTESLMTPKVRSPVNLSRLVRNMLRGRVRLLK